MTQVVQFPTRRESLNDSATVEYSARLRNPGLVERVYFDSEEEAEDYDANSDAYAAWHFGLTLEQYYEWYELRDDALCGGRTRTGTLCKNIVRRNGYQPAQVEAAEWKAAHRIACCKAHRGDGNAFRCDPPSAA